MYSVNARIREVFESSDLSQEKFAKRIKRSRGEVANIIYDKVIPKNEIIEAICEEFGYHEDWIKYGIEPKKAEKSKEEEIAELVGRAISGSSSFKKAVIRMICSRTDAELKVLEDSLRVVYENIIKE